MTIIPAIVIDSNTASGAVTLRGSNKASNGTAKSASPNPNADRISVATNTTKTTYAVVAFIAALPSVDAPSDCLKIVLGFSNDDLDHATSCHLALQMWPKGTVSPYLRGTSLISCSPSVLH